MHILQEKNLAFVAVLFFVQFAGWRHWGRSLPFPIASCLISMFISDKMSQQWSAQLLQIFVALVVVVVAAVVVLTLQVIIMLLLLLLLASHSVTCHVAVTGDNARNPRRTTELQWKNKYYYCYCFHICCQVMGGD